MPEDSPLEEFQFIQPIDATHLIDFTLKSYKFLKIHCTVI